VRVNLSLILDLRGVFWLADLTKPGQVISAVMELSPDPAAVFACALSLHHACLKRAEEEPGLDLSDAYQGMDSFMREVMRVAEMFEEWACRHVAFQELDDVWPYLLEDRFGPACLQIISAESLAGFDADDCLRIASRLHLPLWLDGSLPLPFCSEVPNPLAEAKFQRLRIQAVRHELVEDGEAVPFTEDDDPFDENYGETVFRIYGVDEAGVLKHIADRRDYQAARGLMADLMPGLGFPEQGIAYSQRPISPGGSSGP